MAQEPGSAPEGGACVADCAVHQRRRDEPPPEDDQSQNAEVLAISAAKHGRAFSKHGTHRAGNRMCGLVHSAETPRSHPSRRWRSRDAW